MNQPLSGRSDTKESTFNDDETIRHKPQVLIIEDTVELGEVIQATLVRMGVAVAWETHGAKALERFERSRPDLVLLDIGLPDMKGWTVLDAIKEQRGNLNRPFVVVMTAYSDPANRLLGKLQGVEDYLIKPFTPGEIERVVRHVLGMPPAKHD